MTTATAARTSKKQDSDLVFFVPLRCIPFALKFVRLWCKRSLVQNVKTSPKYFSNFLASYTQVTAFNHFRSSVQVRKQIGSEPCYPSLVSFPFCLSDVNECNDGKHNCKSNQMCMNTYGSFYCVCPRGYSAKTAQSPCEGRLTNYGFLIHLDSQQWNQCYSELLNVCSILACDQVLHLGASREVTREQHAKGNASARLFVSHVKWRA